MIGSLTRWFNSKPFTQQLIILSLVVDPIGFVAGYVFGPSFGLDPLIAGIYGLIAASFATSLFVTNHILQAQ